MKIVSFSSLLFRNSNSKHEGEKQINFRFLLSDLADLAPKVNIHQQDDREGSEDDIVASANLHFGLLSAALETIRTFMKELHNVIQKYVRTI